ncbi:hypothetical protein [Hoeflea marina]|nr:hypothetical protein [Hoeflea marina]
MRHALSAALALSTLVMAGQASAISRIETLGQSCGAIKQTLAREGAAILRHPSPRNSSITLYDRYVSNRGSCTFGEVTQRASVPASDTASCPVLKCYRPDYDDDIMRIRPRFGRD